MLIPMKPLFFFASRRRHTRLQGDWSSDVCSSDLGSLIAMEAAARLGARVSHLVLVGTAYPMKVSPALLDSALSTPEQAIRMVNVFSRATLAPPSGAGSWVFGAGMALGRRSEERRVGKEGRSRWSP